MGKQAPSLESQFLIDRGENSRRNPNRIGISVLTLLGISAITMTVMTVSLVAHRSSTHQHNNIEDTPIATTECGPVEGTFDSHYGINVFRGIPYAVPPVKDLRWKPPRDLKKAKKCWKGVYKATQFASQCVQQAPLTANGTVSGSEDCLYLNILTPSLDKGAKLPVLFWIHGGYLIEGSGASTLPSYFPNAEFVRTMGIVAVSINYRLNAFGFLALDVLSEASVTKTSGNYGFMDQILALKWVQNNIANFGGDYERVSLLGQSSGGTSIYGLLAAESARGLFTTAIAMSGSPVFNKTTKEAAKDNLVFITRSNCVRNTSKETLQCLYDLTPEQVSHAVPWKPYPHWAQEDLTDFPTFGRFDGALAVVDGDVIKYPPGEIHLHPHAGDKVVVVVGTTAQEIGVTPVENFSHQLYKTFLNFITRRLAKFVDKAKVNKAITLYSKMKQPVGSRAQYIYETMASDARVTCPNNLLVANFSKSVNHEVYRYVATGIPSAPIQLPFTMHHPQYAFHMWDTFALFGFYHIPGFSPKESDLSFMHLIQDQVGHLIHYGRPKANYWKTFPSTTAIFGNYELETKGYNPEQCQFWNNHGFFSYAWIN